MANLLKYYRRGRQPHGFWGRRAINAMNSKQHAALPEWVFEQLNLPGKIRILDVGCGGGANIGRLIKLCPDCRLTGLDISQLSIEITTDKNYPAIKDGFCIVVGGNAVQIPLAKEIFDVVTAFETIYYWNSIDSGFSEAFRVLKPGGMVVIANELDGLDPGHEELARAVGGMRIYTPDEIKQCLADAGFTNIRIYQEENQHFLCVTAIKPKS